MAREPDSHFVLRNAAAMAADYLAENRTAPVTVAGGDRGHEAALDFSIRAVGRSAEEVLSDLQVVVDHTPRTGSPRFFNQLFGGHQAVPVAAEMLTAAMNTSMYTHRVAGPHALIETVLLQRLLDAAGMAEGEGMFCPGGSLSNFVGMILARNVACPNAREQGMAGGTLRAYTSESAHYSNRKNAMMSGIGRRHLVTIQVDKQGRMCPESLRQAVQSDLEQGLTPFLVVATSGTTVTGAFDPLSAIHEVAQEANMWMHVDAALGGSALLSSTHQHLLEGVGHADSIAWNAHKLLGVPLSCSVILTRQQGHLHAAFEETADYLFQSDDNRLEPGMRSMQCGRRNDALKLWAAWRHIGDQGMEVRVDRLFALASEAAAIVRSRPGLTLVTEPESVTVCFTVDGADSAQISRQLLEDGRMMVGHADVLGTSVIRLACVNADLTRDDLKAFFDAVESVASGQLAGV